MTLEEMRASDKVTVTPAEAASVLGCSPQGLRMTAREDPLSLGFPVTVIGTRVFIPRAPFVTFLTGSEEATV